MEITKGTFDYRHAVGADLGCPFLLVWKGTSEQFLASILGFIDPNECYVAYQITTA